MLFVSMKVMYVSIFFLSSRHPQHDMEGMHHCKRSLSESLGFCKHESWRQESEMKEANSEILSKRDEVHWGQCLSGVITKFQDQKTLLLEMGRAWTCWHLLLALLKRICVSAFECDQNFKMVLKDKSRTVELHEVTAPPNATWMILSPSKFDEKWRYIGGRSCDFPCRNTKQRRGTEALYGAEFYGADTIHYKNRLPDPVYVRAPTELLSVCCSLWVLPMHA